MYMYPACILLQSGKFSLQANTSKHLEIYSLKARVDARQTAPVPSDRYKA